VYRADIPANSPLFLFTNKFEQKTIHEAMEKLLEDPQVQRMLLEEKHIHIPD